ncbi:DUF6894 family protein [Bosea sp. PAMC 26642]|uniref:DUF6894 family protein n=1 Tax=Bosea sp. (strain PAMC 26642) TaxID=1792307 RepID=UPI0007701C6D|nr:hypothetical protein [Bosea sp. PAMC 26642]AMJ62303.1 hypothetical protein AXW83_20140 [Bosea sp. PAMC 26642]
MPKFYFTTEDGQRVEANEDGVELADEFAAKDEAQNALVDMAREKLPNGKHADFAITVQDAAGNSFYRAKMTFDGQNPKEEDRENSASFDAAVDQISNMLKEMK